MSVFRKISVHNKATKKFIEKYKEGGHQILVQAERFHRMLCSVALEDFSGMGPYAYDTQTE